MYCSYVFSLQNQSNGIEELLIITENIVDQFAQKKLDELNNSEVNELQYIGKLCHHVRLCAKVINCNFCYLV